MKYTILYIMTALITVTTHAQVSHEKLTDLIEKDYLSLLQGIIELKKEIRNTSDRTILDELKSAKSMIIQEYLEGPFAIFDKNAVCQTAYLKQKSKYIEDDVQAFLINYSAKDFQSVFIDVEKIEKSKYNNNWYEVSYVSQGEVSGNITTRKAIVSAEKSQYKIRKLSFATALENDMILALSKDAGTMPTKDLPKVTPKPKAEHVPTPEIIIASIQLVEPEVVHVYLKLKNDKAKGILTAIEDDTPINDIVYDSSRQEYKIVLPYSKLRSRELYLKYSYGTRFIKVRKNLVIFNNESFTATADFNKIPSDKNTTLAEEE